MNNYTYRINNMASYRQLPTVIIDNRPKNLWDTSAIANNSLLMDKIRDNTPSLVGRWINSTRAEWIYLTMDDINEIIQLYRTSRISIDILEYLVGHGFDAGYLPNYLVCCYDAKTVSGVHYTKLLNITSPTFIISSVVGIGLVVAWFFKK